MGHSSKPCENKIPDVYSKIFLSLENYGAFLILAAMNFGRLLQLIGMITALQQHCNSMHILIDVWELVCMQHSNHKTNARDSGGRVNVRSFKHDDFNVI